MNSKFSPLEQADFQRLEHAAYLKGLLKPFKGKGEMVVWASKCFHLRDDLIRLAERRVLEQWDRIPFNLLSLQLAQQRTGAGTTFLRWRNLDRSRMGVAIWEELLQNTSPSTQRSLLNELYAFEQQRIVVNMQVSLTHTLARQAEECANKLAHADKVYQRCICTINPKETHT
ncbi:DUF3158 family protein [Rahnella sp. CG8]|jgi:hypothetical protein|uniref:DUF3158 family protein n=1 Tax=Yersiniaceae TaxID=1903411 RepID=UPI001013C647|nr:MULTISPECIES: DUF3158 family protein [Yersiniaceae]MCM2446264.1 DUF3158 family protein [Rahnella sp. CG8]